MTVPSVVDRLDHVGTEHLVDLARGAALLGTGGGGDPYVGRLVAEHAIREFGSVSVVTVDEVPDDAVVAAVGVIGAPTVGVEKILAGTEVVTAVETLSRELSSPVTHLVCTEIGGSNSMVPILASARTGLPLIDADGMGRAFPELQMLTPGILGHPATPLALADDKGNTTLMRSVDNLWAERIARAATVVMGCSAVYAMYPMSGADARDTYIPGTLSWAWRLGRLMDRARRAHEDVPAVVAAELGGRLIFRGKVMGVDRRTEAGFAVGTARLEGVAGWSGNTLELRFQNEHLVAEIDGRVEVTTPDLLCVMETDTGTPVTTEALRYGARLAVVAAPADRRWRTPAGIALVGPRYFGYDTDYAPVEP